MQKQQKVVDLARYELLKDWERVRDYIEAGKLKGWAICFRDYKDREGVHLGGVFKRDRASALKAALHISMAMNAEDKPQEFSDTEDPTLK